MTTATTSIRCGNHAFGEEAHYHESAQQVRACFQLGRSQAVPALAAPRPVEPSIWTRIKQIPEGRYALREGDRVFFYVVNRPTEGRYKGFTFANKLASDNEIRLGKVEGQRVLRAIAEDPEAASALYGKKSKRCGICHRTLTDDKPGGSIERGIGPVCAQKAGWVG